MKLMLWELTHFPAALAPLHELAQLLWNVLSTCGT